MCCTPTWSADHVEVLGRVASEVADVHATRAGIVAQVVSTLELCIPLHEARQALSPLRMSRRWRRDGVAYLARPAARRCAL
jgi:hypothetical protein